MPLPCLLPTPSSNAIPCTANQSTGKPTQRCTPVHCTTLCVISEVPVGSQMVTMSATLNLCCYLLYVFFKSIPQLWLCVFTICSLCQSLFYYCGEHSLDYVLNVASLCQSLSYYCDDFILFPPYALHTSLLEACPTPAHLFIVNTAT